MDKHAAKISTRPLFQLGQLGGTVGAMKALQGSEELCALLLQRHICGDWGDVDVEDWETNNRALKTRQRLLSAYTLIGGGKIWIITEADRSVTTVLTPDEY